MPSPYANPYGDLTKVNVRGPSPEEQRKAKQASASGDLLRLLGSVAPAAGGLIGGGIGALGAGLVSGGMGAPAGAALGGTLGAGAGQMVGAGFTAGADKTVEPYEEADLARRRRLDAINRVLGSL